MTQCSTSADDDGLVAPDRVKTLVRGLLSAAVAPGGSWTYESLGAATKLKARRLKSYVHEDKEPPLSAALSIGLVLGKPAVNAVLTLIGYGGAAPLDEPAENRPMQMVANCMQHFATIAGAAADDRIDHTEKPMTTPAADAIIAEMIPYSSHAVRS
jgi:hypothetical protein